MKRSETKHQITYDFESHADLMQMLNKFPQHLLDAGANSHTSHGSSFCSYTWDQTMQFLQSGWSEGVTKISNVADQIRTNISEEITGHEIHYDVCGDYIDMGRVMEGIPEDFGSIVPEPQPTESLDIIVNIDAMAMVKQDQIYTRGAAITATIDALKEKYFVNVQFITQTGGLSKLNGKLMKTIFNLNMEHEYSRDLLAFYVANSAMLRRVVFALQEMECDYHDLWGYGHTLNIKVEKDQLYFPCIEYNDRSWDSIDSATKAIKNLLKKYNKEGDK